MKKLIVLFLLSSQVLISYSQSTEEIHIGKVIGSYSFMDKEITTIYDQVSNCIRKTAPHSTNLFVSGENIQIKISTSHSLGIISKTELSETVSIVNCNNTNNTNCNSDLCIINQSSNNLQLSFTQNDNKIFFNVYSDENGSTKSKVIFYLGSSNFSTNYFLNKSDTTKYKYLSHIEVINEADSLIGLQSQQDVIIADKIIELFISKIKNNNQLGSSVELLKNIFYHASIIKTIVRANADNSNCNCAPIPSYFTDLTPFLCQEDVKYNINELLANIEENKILFLQKYDTTVVEYITTYLRNKSINTSELMFEETYFDLAGISKTQFIDYIENPAPSIGCLYGPGSGLGCCGNYSGCCWYWSYNCFLHDVACLHCDKWHCGPLCQSVN